MCCWERETKQKLDWKNVLLNTLYYSYDLSGPAYPLVRARYVKISTAWYNIEKKKEKEEEEGTSVTKRKKQKMKMGNDGKCTGWWRKQLSSFTWTLFKVDYNVKGAVVVRLSLPFKWSITTASLLWSTENSTTAVTGVFSCPVNVERGVDDGC